jgi:hypothetical protein
MDQTDEFWDQVQELLAERNKRRHPRRAGPPKRRRMRDKETNRVVVETSRPFRRVSAAVYYYLAEQAQAHSLDISRLVLATGLGKVRIRQRQSPADRPPRTRVIRMTITSAQEQSLKELMIQHKSSLPDPTAFAIAAALGHVPAKPDAPVLLTFEEEQLLLVVGCVRALSEICFSKPTIKVELERECDAVRPRLEQNGEQPGDKRACETLMKIMEELEVELRVCIHLPDIAILWDKMVQLVSEIGQPASRI